MDELDGCVYTLVPGLGLVLGARPLPVSGLRLAPCHPASLSRAAATVPPDAQPGPVGARRAESTSTRSKSFALEPVRRWSVGESLLVPARRR